MAQTLLVASYLGTTYSLHQFNYLSAVFFLRLTDQFLWPFCHTDIEKISKYAMK